MAVGTDGTMLFMWGEYNYRIETNNNALRHVSPAGVISSNMPDLTVLSLPVRIHKVLRRRAMRITAKGQVTIPVEIRERLGLLPNSEVQFEVVGNAVRIRKARARQTRGRSLVARLRGKGTVRMRTEEILALMRGET